MQKKVTKRSGKEKNKHLKSNSNSKKNNKNTSKVKADSSDTQAISTRRSEIIGVLFVAVGLISICGLAGLNVGYIGKFVAQFLKWIFGIGSAVVSLLFIVVGGYHIMKHQRLGFTKTSVGVVLLLMSLLGLYHHLVIPNGAEILPSSLSEGGGLIGGVLAFVLHKPLGNAGTTIIFFAAIIGSILLATPWSLASGIIFTKEASEKGAGMAMDMAEVVYDGAKNVGSKVQNQVGEQVQRLKTKTSFYDQSQDESFYDDGPVMAADSQASTASGYHGGAASRQRGEAGDIDTIIRLDGSTDIPAWQAPEYVGNKQEFDGPDMNGYTEAGNFDNQASFSDEEYVSEFAKKAAGNLDKNLRNLDTSGYVNVHKNKVPRGTFDNWRLKGNIKEDNSLSDDASAEFDKADLAENNSDALAEETSFSQESKADEELSAVFSFDEDTFDDVEGEVLASNDERPLIVNSFDDLLAEDRDESAENESTMEEAVENQEELTDIDSFSIEFSSDNDGESSFTKSLAEDDIGDISAPVAEAGEAEELVEKTDEQPEMTDKLAMAAQLAQAVEEEKELPPYEVPDVNLILDKKNKEKDEELEQEISEKAKVLAQTLQDFKVKASILSACHGPAVTRYEVKLAPGVKVNKLTGLADDIALSMAASSVRIEQIPNRSTIGIEVPNRKLESVQLREVLENPAFKEARSNLTVGFGKDISGKAIFANLADMPHLLVAGATGSGKSVCINTIVTSILFKAKPDEVKFIMIDPKMVELSVYNDIPHLMVPVVTDARKAAAVLNWSVQEMEKRYGLIAEAGVRNIETYNQYYAEDKSKQMPSVVIIIDELADLMMVAPHDVEDAICRLAQKARAAGIYLVLATQRPSVNVITGVIKANIPSRISFAVTSQIDSRTILDSSGAEKLLGKGDMLFKPQTEPKAVRVQGAFVSDIEVERLVESIRQQGHKCEINQEIIDFTNKTDDDSSDGEEAVKTKSNVDELLRPAVEMVMQTGNASASSFQRRYHIGYTRAGRLLDTMEQLKIVGPPQGSKPRDILVTEEQAFEIMDKLEEYLKEEK